MKKLFLLMTLASFFTLNACDEQKITEIIKEELSFSKNYNKLKEIIIENSTICHLKYLESLKVYKDFNHPEVKYWSNRHASYFNLLQYIDVLEGKSLIPPDDLDY